MWGFGRRVQFSLQLLQLFRSIGMAGLFIAGSARQTPSVILGRSPPSPDRSLSNLPRNMPPLCGEQYSLGMSTGRTGSPLSYTVSEQEQGILKLL